LQRCGFLRQLKLQVSLASPRWPMGTPPPNYYYSHSTRVRPCARARFAAEERMFAKLAWNSRCSSLTHSLHTHFSHSLPRTFTLHTLSHYVFEKNLPPPPSLSLSLYLASSPFQFPYQVHLGANYCRKGFTTFFLYPKKQKPETNQRKFASTQKTKKKRKSNLSHELCVSTPRSRTVSKA